MTERPEWNYSIQNLQQSLKDVMEGEFTPQEIHEVMMDTIKDNMRYYKACYNDSVRLLALMKGNTNKNIKVIDGDSYTEKEYWEGRITGKDFQEALEKYGFDYTPIDKSKFKLDSPELHNNEDDN